ncbi:MFS general substrate transporter [Coniophora puteana RWD-64-598 SS2]|uniref:MFS general substrate transporter n=1 Tax=Coniophora puteana (strain RWD-64-598) TaxID=741705 RepID=A0A5M3MHJ4_CONPW|nr:MFS general substrate transporter [Coniophora puteana RWD-64-598 SS2]EIW78672.1 MFS general substrate transporter [Coniophora puteana RWD-64-598 SS2]
MSSLEAGTDSRHPELQHTSSSDKEHKAVESSHAHGSEQGEHDAPGNVYDSTRCLSPRTPPSGEKSPSSPQPPPQADEPPVTVSRTHFFLIMISLWLGNFTAYFNETTATTAMHEIGSYFAAMGGANANAQANQNWIATAYLLGFTVTQVLLGRFADIFGRARVFYVTMAVFAAGTLWCGLAQSMNSLIGARLLQGIGAAGRQSVGVIIVLDLTTARTRGIWLGFFNGASALGLALGPIIGAVLSTSGPASWRWLFWITLIMIGITFCVGCFSLRNLKGATKNEQDTLRRMFGEVDWIGCLLAVAISALACVAIESGNKMYPWNSAPIIAMLLVAICLVPVFAFWELYCTRHGRHPPPLLNIRLLQIRNIPQTCIINFLTGAAYFGCVFFLPRYLVDVRGSSLVQSGVQMFGLTLSLGAFSVLGANILGLTGKVKALGIFAGGLYALGSGLMLLVTRTTPMAHIIGFGVLAGTAAGLLYQPALVVGPMSVRREDVAGISGFLSFLRTFGGTVATALLTAIFETSFTSTLNAQGVIPKSLVSQGLALADAVAAADAYEVTCSWAGQYAANLTQTQCAAWDSDVREALVGAYRLGQWPAVAFGIVYAIGCAFMSGVDFKVQQQWPWSTWNWKRRRGGESAEALEKGASSS